MKFIFMLLTLFVLTNPVLAKPVDNTSECPQMYGSYINKYGTSKAIPDGQMLNFIARCIPANAAYDDKQESQKLLWSIGNNVRTITVKA